MTELHIIQAKLAYIEFERDLGITPALEAEEAHLRARQAELQETNG